jgi:N-acetylglucosaminyldiphosphoundecaprenol N-acetyl-beta-D-mannosaminyltransferase
VGKVREYPERINILGTGVSTVNMDSAVEHIFDSVESSAGGYVCVTGAHGILESQKDSNLRRVHNNSLLTVPDGMPNVWLGKLRGVSDMGRVYGPDLMLEVCRRSVGACRTHFMFGATNQTLQKLKFNLEEKFPGIRIVGMYSPPFRPLTSIEESELQRRVADCAPDFFWVGLSTPKQELFMAAHSPLAQANKFPLDAKIMFGVGAAFDFHAGNMKDAPQWVKNIGMQWFHRLCSEPKRLWRRYGYIVPAFIWFNVLQFLRFKRYEGLD